MIDDTQLQAIPEVPVEGDVAVQQEEAAPEVAHAEARQPQETLQQKDLNFRNLREAKERAERERDELMRRMQEIEARNQQLTPEDPEPNLNPDDLVEWKYVKKEINKLKQELKGYQQHSSQASAEARLKSQYPDFDKVVTKDTIEQLSQAEPELAATLRANTDLYGQAVSAYKLIKKLGLYQEDTYQEDRERAQRNAAKPKPLTSIAPQQGDSPLSRANAFANGLTPELKEQLRKEMMSARRGY